MPNHPNIKSRDILKKIGMDLTKITQNDLDEDGKNCESILDTIGEV